MFLFFVCLCFPVAFLGDIALDEEDMRLFKVDRIIDLAQRTVQNVNHTDEGNNKRCHLKRQWFPFSNWLMTYVNWKQYK